MSASTRQLSKSATGISGLDEITGGGVPTGRPTLAQIAALTAERTVEAAEVAFALARENLESRSAETAARAMGRLRGVRHAGNGGTIRAPSNSSRP